MENKTPIYKSRKFYAALAGLAVALFGERAGLTADQISEAVIVIATYIGGVSLEAFKK